VTENTIDHGTEGKELAARLESTLITHSRTFSHESQLNATFCFALDRFAGLLDDDTAQSVVVQSERRFLQLRRSPQSSDRRFLRIAEASTTLPKPQLQRAVDQVCLLSSHSIPNR
jgi:hypothetical protein